MGEIFRYDLSNFPLFADGERNKMKEENKAGKYDEDRKKLYAEMGVNNK